MKLSDIPSKSFESIDPKIISGFRKMVQEACDELDLDYDVLEPSGWAFRQLPDGRWWAEHPAAGHAERWGRQGFEYWQWHGKSTTWIGSGQNCI